jgi:pyridoxamine 5'-phosphate oxidase-like protein
VAVRTPRGPHLTPVVYVLDGGRLWVTTARRSVKARGWRRLPEVAGMVVEGDDTVTFRGRVKTFDAFDPTSWPAAVLAGPKLLEAATRFTLKNARFFAGYAVDARKVPLSWTPPGRVFAAVTPTAGRILAGAEPAGGWGPWPAGSRSRREFEHLPRRRPLDLRVPQDVRRALGVMGTGALALEGDAGLAVLPVAWRRIGTEGAYEAMLPARVLDLAQAGPDAPAGLAVDEASHWRASAMTGLLLQGKASLYRPDSVLRGRAPLLERLGGDERLALVRLRPDRIVWWGGWSSGSVTAGERARPPRGRVGAVSGAGGVERAAGGRR